MTKVDLQTFPHRRGHGDGEWGSWPTQNHSKTNEAMKEEPQEHEAHLNELAGIIRGGQRAAAQRLNELREVILSKIKSEPGSERQLKEIFKSASRGLSEAQIEMFFRGEIEQLVEDLTWNSFASKAAQEGDGTFPA